MRYLRVRGRNSDALYRLFKLKFSPIIDINFNIIFNMIVLLYLETFKHFMNYSYNLFKAFVSNISTQQ